MSMILSEESEIPGGSYLADCAVSGGTLRQTIQRMLRAAGGKLCLRLQPIYMDFPLPCPSGIGQEISQETLTAIRRDTPCFFSEELCMEYAAALREDQLHVLLYDTPETLQRKFRLAEELEVPYLLVEDPALRQTL